MHDNGRGVARVFDKLLVLSWVLLVGGVVWHVHQWDPTTPFITEPLIDRVFLYSLILGMWGSFAAWWDITAEKNPWRLLSLRQVLEWLTGPDRLLRGLGRVPRRGAYRGSFRHRCHYPQVHRCSGG